MNCAFTVIAALSVAAAGGCSSTALVGKNPSPWPVVQPSVEVFKLLDRTQPEARKVIDGADGRPLFLLECYLNAYEKEDAGFDYSGDFECRLTPLQPAETEVHSTLLTDVGHPTRDWQSRGRFFFEELSGPCALYPDFGATRRFVLRGMQLTLKVLSVKVTGGSAPDNPPWNRERLSELDLEVSVSADPLALSEVAAPSLYLEPPYADPDHPDARSRLCTTVLKR